MTSTVKKIILCVFIILTVAWVGFIFANSLDSGPESSEKSSAVTEAVNEVADSVGIDKPIKESTVRNMAHFLEFAVLSLLICADMALLTYLRRSPWRTGAVYLMAAAPICCLVACVDELIQKFSAGRAAQFSDVLTDTLGAICSMVLFISVYTLIFVLKQHKAAKNTP